MRGEGSRTGRSVTAQASQNHAPEPAWGDTFFFYAPEGDAPGNRRFPFATIVIKVYAGFDTASNLNRFRLNIAVGRDKFKELIGYSPARFHWTSSRLRLRRPDQLLPHPVYASQSWACILNPGAASSAHPRPVVPRSYPSQRTPPAAAVTHFRRRSAAA